MPLVPGQERRPDRDREEERGRPLFEASLDSPPPSTRWRFDLDRWIREIDDEGFTLG